MKSMTGFGRATADFKDFSLTADVSSVNKKGLEISVGLPREWQAMERLVAQKIKGAYVRGKVNVSLRLEQKNADSPLKFDSAALKSALANLASACADLGVKFAPTQEIVIKLAEKISENSETESADWETLCGDAEKTLDDAISNAEKMRVAEGDALKADISARLDAISNMVERVEAASKGTVATYREALMQRLSNAGLELELNDERVLKELCLFADKCDICEEITRLKSHIAQFRSAMEESDAVGRKMDFICQEMGREINTIASKANSLDITKLAIELKNELERIREQIQNVE